MSSWLHHSVHSQRSKGYCYTKQLLWNCFGFLSQQIIGTVHLDVISKIFLHIRFAVWVQEGLLYRPQDYCTGLLKLVSSQVKGSMSSVRYEQSLWYDRSWSTFFKTLYQQNLPNSVIQFLLQWYNNQHLEIRWNGILSSPFSVTNGVQQGGVLSPVLFTVYIDELLQVCKNLVWVVNGKGCLLVVSVMQMISFDCTLCSCAQKDASSLFRFCLRKPWHLVQGKLNWSVSVHISLWLWMKGYWKQDERLY